MFKQVGLVEAMTSQLALLEMTIHNHVQVPIDGIFISGYLTKVIEGG